MSVDVVADTPIVQSAGARHILTSFKLRRSPPPNAFSLSYKNPVNLEKTLISYAVQQKRIFVEIYQRFVEALTARWSAPPHHQI